jgi:ABC-2 type transport system permease protein
MSALTRSQLVAMALTSLLLLVFFIVGLGEFVVAEGTVAHAVCAYVSVWGHMNDFASGIVDSRRLVFYGTMIALPLYVSTRAVETWKWG